MYIFKWVAGVMLNFRPKRDGSKCVWLKVGATGCTEARYCAPLSPKGLQATETGHDTERSHAKS